MKIRKGNSAFKIHNSKLKTVWILRLKRNPGTFVTAIIYCQELPFWYSLFTSSLCR